MALKELSASLVAGSDVVAESGEAIPASAEFPAESSATLPPTVLLTGSVSPAGSSAAMFDPIAGRWVDLGLQAGAELVGAPEQVSAGQATATGEASLAADPRAQFKLALNAQASATLTAAPEYAILNIAVTMAGSADLRGDVTTLGAFGQDSYGGAPFGGLYPPYGLESAVATSANQVRVRFNAMFDASAPLLLSSVNYSISPPIAINSVLLESAQSVLLNTAPLGDAVYTVTILNARGYFGQPLNPSLTVAQFSGVSASIQTAFYSVATRKDRVRVVFSTPMQPSAALTDPAQYGIVDLAGNAIPIVSVTAEQLTNVRSTVLHLGEDLRDGRDYRITVLGGVVSQGSSVVAGTALLKWVETPQVAQLSSADFSGEALGGLFGIHGGLVFFSPALETAAANSVIQVDEVDVCTRAYDEYHFPVMVDPRPLMTHGAGVVPTLSVSTLNTPDQVLWASFPRLMEARFELGLGGQQDTVPAPTDGPAKATLTETWPLARVSLLNNAGWKLFDNTSNPPAYFATALNMTAFPAPAVVERTL